MRQNLPVLPHLNGVMTRYYRGQATYLPFKVFGPAQPFYVVCLDRNEQGVYSLAYQCDGATGGLLACATWREAWRVCRQLSEAG